MDHPDVRARVEFLEWVRAFPDEAWKKLASLGITKDYVDHVGGYKIALRSDTPPTVVARITTNVQEAIKKGLLPKFEVVVYNRPALERL